MSVFLIFEQLHQVAIGVAHQETLRGFRRGGGKRKD